MLNLLIPYFGYSPWIIHRLDMRTSGEPRSAMGRLSHSLR